MTDEPSPTLSRFFYGSLIIDYVIIIIIILV